MRGVRASERGFTLTELMVTVGIIGVLVALGITLLRATPQPHDVASQVSSALAETSRKAVAGGAVRADVAAALGSPSRTRAVFTATTDGVTVTIERLEEDALPSTSASWVMLTSKHLHRSVTLAGYTPTAVLADGGSPSVSVGTTGTFEVRCNPDGTCTGITLYLENDRGGRRARVVVLPLGGTPMTFAKW